MGLEGVVAMVVVVVGEGQFFLHPVGFPNRRFTLLSIDTDGVSNARGVLLLIDDGDGWYYTMDIVGAILDVIDINCSC